MSVPVKIYDENREIVADLEKAYDINYTKTLNEVWTAAFSYPADHDKNDLIQGHYYAEIYDSGKRLGLFRIDEPIENRDDSGVYVTYECSHVLDTLNDEYISKTGKVTKSGAQTATQYLIDQQSDWQLGDFDFSKGGFDYEFNRQTLLSALLSIPQVWWEDWELTFNTRSYPWTINIKQPNTTPKGTMRYSKNLVSLERDINYKEIVTRLYAYGEGSGDDQIDISSANPTGNKYVDSDNTSEYGVIVDIWEEQYFNNSGDLFQAAKKYLAQHDSPRTTYRGAAADLYQLTDLNRFTLGEYVTVYDPDLDLDVKVRVTELRKGDLTGEPGRLNLELSNKSRLFPNYGALAFKDEATEDNLAPGSVSGGVGGALGGGSVGTNEIAGEAVTWDEIEFKTASGDNYKINSLEIDAATTFKANFTEIDKLEDGTTYAKMQKSWRSASDVTKIAGGEIYTDSVDLDRINFSPTASKNIVGQINANDNGITIDAELIEIDGTTKFVSDDFDPSTKLGETETAVNTDKVQNYTIIEGGRIKTGILEADVIRYDGGTLVVDEGGSVSIEYDADKTNDHTSNDTANVNSTPAATVDSRSQDGATAHLSLSVSDNWSLSNDVVQYADATSLETLKPAQPGADVTAANPQKYSWHSEKLDLSSGDLFTGKLDIDVYSNAGALAREDTLDLGSSLATGTNASNIDETTSLKWASESGADVTGTHEAASISGQGALATKNDAEWPGDIADPNSKMPEDNADETALQFDTLSLSQIENGAEDGSSALGSLSSCSNWDLTYDSIKWGSGFLLDALEPAEAGADETQAHEGDVDCLNTKNHPAEKDADQTIMHTDNYLSISQGPGAGEYTIGMEKTPGTVEVRLASGGTEKILVMATDVI